VFAYEVTFHVPGRELFAGVFQQVRRTTIRRVRTLQRRLDAAEPDKLTAQKLTALKKVLEQTPEP
jgi:hypothetical protein